jgi:zinc transporter ZupT
LDAIGGLGAGTAYVLHKFLEGVVIGVVAVLAGTPSKKSFATLGFIAGIPTLIGFAVGVPGLIEATYFFALGGAGALYIVLKLIPSFALSKDRKNVLIAALLGFYSVYVASLFHG